MKRKIDKISKNPVIENEPEPTKDSQEFEDELLGLLLEVPQKRTPIPISEYSNPEPPDSKELVWEEDNKENDTLTKTAPVLQNPPVTKNLIHSVSAFDDYSNVDSLSPSLYPPSEFNSNNLKQCGVDRDYIIHSLATLHLLLHEKLLNKEKRDLRFIVDTQGKAWFARESHNKYPSPAHYEMTGAPQNEAKCRTAGNLWFSDDYKTLLKINNKSGDFKPDFDSIKWFLAILVLNEEQLPFRLPEVLIVEELINSRYIDVYEWNVSDIRTWVKNVITEEAIRTELRTQPQSSKRVSYKSDIQNNLVPISNFGFFEQNKSMQSGDQISSRQTADISLELDLLN